MFPSYFTQSESDITENSLKCLKEYWEFVMKSYRKTADNPDEDSDDRRYCAEIADAMLAYLQEAEPKSEYIIFQTD